MPLIGTPSRGYFWCWSGSKKAQTHSVRPHTERASRSMRRRMGGSVSKFIQPLASKQERDGTEKRGRGRPRKQPSKEPSEVPTPKRPRGQPKGSKNKGAAKTQKVTTIPGRKPRGRTKKLEKEEDPRSPRRRSSDHLQCRLLLGHCGAAFPWDWKPCSQTTPRPLCTLPHQAPAAGSAAPTGAGFGSVPVPSFPTHLPTPDKVNFPSSRSPACCAPPSEP